MKSTLEVCNLVELLPPGEARLGKEVLAGLIAPVNVGDDRPNRQASPHCPIDQVEEAAADSLALDTAADVD